MSRKIYKRFGLRRDKNFGDLSSAKLSLNNLLDGLVDDVDSSFISDDLNAIRNISNVGLTNGQYKVVVGSTTMYTTSAGANIEYKPHITFQNKLDRFKVFSGNPRIAGGDGLTARYWQKDQIIPSQGHDPGPHFQHWKNTNSSESEVLAGVTTMGQIPPDTHWERGQFDYTGKLHPQSVLTDGGVTWEGYFVPARTGIYAFNIKTTGYVTFDFNLDGYEEDLDKVQTPESITAVGAGNTYKEWNRVGVNTTFNGNSASANSNTLTIKADFSKTIGVGMSVSGSGIVNDGDVWPTIEEYSNNINGSTSTVTLKPVPGQTNSIGGSALNNATLTFFRNTGTEVGTNFNTQYLIALNIYRIRIRFFFPKDVNTNKLERYIKVDYTPPNGSSTHLYYYHLFPLDYKFSATEKGDFNKYFDSSVRFGGTNASGIGGRTPISGGTNFSGDNPYVRIYTNNKVHAKYNPKTSLSGIQKRSQSCSGTTGSVILDCNNTGGIEVGNYVFGPNADESTNLTSEGSRVIEVLINDSIVLDKPAQVTATQTLDFIDHRGFVKRVKGAATTSGGTIVNFASGYKTDDTDLWQEKITKDMIVLTTKQGGGDVNSYTRITTVNDSDTITLNNGMTNSANTKIYIYQSKGLIDRSLETFCPQSGSAITRCVVVSANTNKADAPREISLSSLNGLTVTPSMTIQGFGIPDGTTLTDVSSNPVTISADLTKDIAAGATVTIFESTLTGDRQLCCPPTDTSPPFSSSPDGLMTPDDKRNISVKQGNIKFDELKFKFPNTLPSETNTSNNGKVEKYTTTDPINRQIHIRTAPTPDQTNGLFYLLGETV